MVYVGYGGSGARGGGKSNTVPIGYQFPDDENTRQTITVSSQEVNAEPPTLNLPMATYGDPIPLVLGRQRITRPNTLWFGDAITERTVTREENADGTVVNKTITYDYFLAVQLGICLGPDTRLVGIYSGDVELWSGVAAGAPTIFAIDNPETQFKATARFYNGSYSQPIDTYLDSVISTDFPAYVGVSHIIFERMAVDQTRQLRGLALEVERFPNPLGLTVGENEDGNGNINVVTAMYEVIKQEWGGCGVPTDLIDTPAFYAAAQLAATENQYCAITLGRQTDGNNVLSPLKKQFDCYVYHHPKTGLITIVPLRENYDPSGLDLFDENNLITIQGYGKKTYENAVNYLAVEITDRDNNYFSRKVTAHNPVAINRSGGIRADTVGYPQVYDRSLGSELAARDLRRMNLPLYGMSVLTNRDGRDYLPGDVLKVSWPEYGITEAVMRVSRVKRTPPLDGSFIIEVSQDTFKAGEEIFAVPADSDFSYGGFKPGEITTARIDTVPYFLYKLHITRPFIGLEDQAAFPLFLVERPTDKDEEFSAKITDYFGDSSLVLGDDISIKNRASYGPTGRLSAAISFADGFTTGQIASITLTDGNFLDEVSAGGIDWIRNGSAVAFIGDEIIGFETITDNGDGTFTLGSVHRGLLDTLPKDHAAGDVVYFSVKEIYGEAPFPQQYGVNNNWNVQFRSFAANKGVVSPGDFVWTMKARIGAPLPVDDLRIDGVRKTTAYVISADDVLDFTWKERNRVNTEISLFGDPTETVEAGTSYNVGLFVGGLPQRTDFGVTGNSHSYVVPAGVATGAGEFRIQTLRETPFGEFYYALETIVIPVNVQ